jgi:hypothetical protein
MKSDTPRTDERTAVDIRGIKLHVHSVTAEFARELERELNESQAQSHGLTRRVVEVEMKLEVAERDLAALKADEI